MHRILLILLLALPAHAQILSIYGTFSPAHLSNIQTGAVYSATGGYVNQTASYWAPGFGGGLTLNFIPRGPLRLGLDLRGSTKPGTSGADSALFGVKLGIHPPVLRIKPYVQGSIGYLDSRTLNLSTISAQSAPIGGTFNNKYFAYEFLGGVDYPLLGPLDLRVIELGVGSGVGILSNYNPVFFTVNTGLVVHF